MSTLPSLPAAAPAPDDGAPLEHADIACLQIVAGLHHRRLSGDRRQIMEQISRFRTKGEVRAYGRQVAVALRAAAGVATPP